MAEEPTPISEPTEAQERRAFARDIHSYLGDFARSADQKAGLVLAASVALLGYTFGKFWEDMSVPRLLMLAIALILISSIILAVHAIWPRQHRKEAGLLGWEAISHVEFPMQFQRASLQTLTDDTLKHSTALAGILRRKYPSIRFAVLTLLLGASVVVAALTCQSRWYAGPKHRQIRVHFDPLGPEPHKDFDYDDWAHAFWAGCAPFALMLPEGEENSDYSVETRWAQGHWEAEVFRNDRAFIYKGENADSHRLLRSVCRAIRDDAPRWITLDPDVSPAELAKNMAAKERARTSDRYEVRDIRNGAVTTTALIDKRTGRVWVWTKLSNGQTEFLEEEVTPRPDHEE